MSGQAEQTVVGSGRHQYRAVPEWAQLPAGWSFVEAVGVATDSADRVFVFCRGEHPVIVFAPDGSFLNAWGEGEFQRPHGIWIGPDDCVYLSDDFGHTVRKYSPDGRLLLTLGTSGQPSPTGVRDVDYRTLKQPAGPFNLPTNLVLGPRGEMYVSDGYGNCRVHKFSPEGELLRSWGTPGDGPGQFHLPHGIGIDSRERIFVADRENSRLQLFSPEGEFLEEWTHVLRPCEVYVDRSDVVYVAELGARAGMFPWMSPDESQPGGRVSVFDADGNLLSRWGGGQNPCDWADFFAPHDIWIDSQGAVYVGEVTWSAGGKDGLVPPDCPSLRKFAQLAPVQNPREGIRKQ